MTIRATQKYTRQTSRKVRFIANTIKKLPIEAAMQQLSVIERKATEVVAKVLRQAVADATHNHGLLISDLQIDQIYVNEGPRYRRFQAVSRGRAHGIIKRTSHVTVILKTKEAAVEPKVEKKAETKAEEVKPVVQEAKPVAKAAVAKKATPRKTTEKQEK